MHSGGERIPWQNAESLKMYETTLLKGAGTKAARLSSSMSGIRKTQCRRNLSTTILQAGKLFPTGPRGQFWYLRTCSLGPNEAVRVGQRAGVSALTVSGRGKQGEACVSLVATKILQFSRLNWKEQQDEALWPTKQKLFIIWPLAEHVSRPLTWKLAFTFLMLLNCDNSAYEERIVISRKLKIKLGITEGDKLMRKIP